MVFANTVTTTSVGLGYCHKFFKDAEKILQMLVFCLFLVSPLDS